jgi:predicted small lipoprotein YifL
MKKTILCFILFITLAALAACETTGGSQLKDSYKPPSGVGIYEGPNGS